MECGAIGADLDIALNGPITAYLSLKNFRTVVSNTSSQTLKFKVNHSSVGSVEWKQGETWFEVLPAAVADSSCDVEVTRLPGNDGNNISLSMKCRDLVPKSNRLSLLKKESQRLPSIESSEKLACAIQPSKR